MTEYYSAFKWVDEKLKMRMPLTPDLNEMRKQWEQLSVLKFLPGMKLELELVRAQILGGVTLPTIAEAYSRVLHTVSTELEEGSTSSASAFLGSHTHAPALVYVENLVTHGGVW